MNNQPLALILALVVLGGCATEPKFTDIVISDKKDGRTPVFKTDTAEIFIFFGLENIKSGSKIKGVWICEKAKDIPENFKIDEASVDVGMIDNMGNFSLSKPNKGWPVGDYRVELYVDDKKIDERKFKVAP